MQNLVFTQLSVMEVRQFLRRELQLFFEHTRTLSTSNLITLPQAAQVLNISEDELTRLAENNDILHYRHDSEYLFIKEEMKQIAEKYSDELKKNKKPRRKSQLI